MAASPDEAAALHVEVNGRRFTVRVEEPEARVTREERRDARKSDRSAHRALRPVSDGVTCSLQGTISAGVASAGQEVAGGPGLFVIGGMKMENEITAPHAGVIADVRVQVGQTVEAGTVLATYRGSTE